MYEAIIVRRRALIGMRLDLVIAIALLLVSQIRSNYIILRPLSLFIQQHWHNNISQIHRLNVCKYSKVRIEAIKRVFIIVSKTQWCNEVIKTVFGASVATKRNNSNVIAWATPYNHTGWMNPGSRCEDDAYFDNATKVAYGLARVDLFCRKRRSRLGPRIWKRSVMKSKQKKHESRPYTVRSDESLFTITIGVLLYVVFGICFLAANLAYLFGIFIVYDSSVVEGDKKRTSSKRAQPMKC
ncbi:hypothetical protein LOAG_13341 [Loa loa]|uniref:SCP domain-containing protein n=1 Tax=Loa loa TaxID=7209 RepID=A0A1I7W4M9_LOALO|nr:hypothetical protein LOAG_13341 [Loa loa]EFO15171.1 hypothetical protein LOAG_13341 [Loa loa]